jgi:MFS family permease
VPRRFLAYLVAAGVNDAGYLVAYVAQGWLVVKLTNSPFWLGVVFGTGQLPFVLFSLLGGKLADSFDRRTLIAACNVLLALVAAATAWLVWTGTITIWLLTLLAFCTGTIVALEHPVDRAWLYDLVAGKQLGRSIALSSLEWSVARTAGPALGGVVVAALGVAAGYGIFALCTLPLAALAIALGRRAARTRSRRRAVAVEAATRAPDAPLDPVLVPFCILIATFTIGVNPYVALMPDIAKNVLHQDVRGYGALMACGGAGAIASAAALAALGELRAKGRIVAIAAFAGAVLLVAFTLVRSPLVAGALLVAIGAIDNIMYALANTYVQQRTGHTNRGRANAVFTLAFLGGIPVGNLAVGALAGRVGSEDALRLSALFVCVACVVFWLGAPRARDAA